MLLADGCRIIRSQVYETVIGIRSLIGPQARLTRTVMMGADYYETEADKSQNANSGRPNIGVGQGCLIESAIIDKNARIGDDIVIRHLPDREDSETENYVVRDGLVIVMKNGLIPSRTVI